MTTVAPEKRAPKDYASDQEVRWCPGCGDYAIIKAAQKALADLQVDPDQTVFVSGIGCAARFPYYMNTYGFHTIHGRAPAVATGVKLANPDLDVWVISGDGDALSIGGNHLLHLLRRNVDLQFLLFNNEIYGLTKGQYSPTSRVGTRSPSTPQGSLDTPVSACELALGAGARFVARAIDIQQPKLVEILKRAAGHRLSRSSRTVSCSTTTCSGISPTRMSRPTGSCSSNTAPRFVGARIGNTASCWIPRP